MDAISGKTIRFTFVDGPTAGKTYEHTFGADGTVVFKEVETSDSGEDKSPRAKAETKKGGTKYASFALAPDLHLVSYLSDNGYTLTVALNLATKRIHAFASNDKAWYPITGTLEIVK